MPAWLKWALKKFQRIFGFTVPMVSHPMPRKSHVTTVVGTPIEVTKNDHPSPEEVAKMLVLFTERLEELYYKHASDKEPFHPEKPKLTIL